MVENEKPRNPKAASIERSSDEIRQDIAKGGENISQTVEQIGERLKEKLDWREYVNQSPYWALGAAVGLGFIVSRMIRPRPAPQERMIHAIADEIRGSLGGILAKAAGPSIVKVTLLGLATTAATNWIKGAASASASAPPASGGNGAQPQSGFGSTQSTRVDL